TSKWGVKGFAYSPKKHLKTYDHPVFECNSRCQCSPTCRNKVIYHEPHASVEIRRVEGKGWCVFNGPGPIEAGVPVGFLAGEMVTRQEGEDRAFRSQNRNGDCYIFDIDFWYLQGTHHSNAGEFTRFLSHSCDPNVRAVGVYVNERSMRKPIISFFARRKIRAGEELSISYIDERASTTTDAGQSDEASPHTMLAMACKCGSVQCRGMPSMSPRRCKSHFP
ncbi:SET domain-containing protein, partial [Schizophyllum commune]